MASPNDGNPADEIFDLKTFTLRGRRLFSDPLRLRGIVITAPSAAEATSLLDFAIRDLDSTDLVGRYIWETETTAATGYTRASWVQALESGTLPNPIRFPRRVQKFYRQRIRVGAGMSLTSVPSVLSGTLIKAQPRFKVRLRRTFGMMSVLIGVLLVFQLILRCTGHEHKEAFSAPQAAAQKQLWSATFRDGDIPTWFPLHVHADDGVIRVTMPAGYRGRLPSVIIDGKLQPYETDGYDLVFTHTPAPISLILGAASVTLTPRF